ncbi:MAG TPA: hypothetical protein VFT98_01370 [Myxococcota bacterium]|nr:hypothetical protein [Myxococcota bacterium]
MSRSVPFALLFALACRTPSTLPGGEAAEKPAVRTSSEDYRVPQQIGEFMLQRLADIEPAEAGFSARYRGPDEAERLDFFVFSARNMPSEISVADMLWAQYEQTKREVEYAAQHAGWNANLTSEQISRAATPQGEFDGVLARFEGRAADGAPLRSLAFLALVGTDFVKMRATRIGTPSAASDAALDEARTAFLAALALRQPRAKPKYATHVDVSSNDDAGCTFMVTVGYAAVLEQLLERGMFLHTLDRQVALLDGAVGIGEFAGGAECRNPALRHLIATREHGFLREYAWSFSRPSFWPDPGDLRLAEFEKFWEREGAGRAGVVSFGVRLEFAGEYGEPATAAETAKPEQ